MIVVDVGCMTHPGKGRLAGAEESLTRLAEQFRPGIIFGFDPHPDLEEGVYEFDAGDVGGTFLGTTLVLRRAVAWGTPTESLPILVNGDRTCVPRNWPYGVDRVPAFDLSAFLPALPPPVVLKLDCEGAEFPILKALRERNLDLALDRVLVEWHEGTDPDGEYYGHGWAAMGRTELRCPTEDW